ncbi:WUSCHEL-related homeobox 9-like [Forsythia ovata]
MVNPPRDEIRKIRAQLQQYGQVGDANVFYWFQNRKSRSKQKNRQLHHTKSQTHYAQPITTTMAATASIPPLSSSSSNKSSPSSTEKVIFSVGSTTLIDVSNSPTASANQSFFQTPSEFLAEPYFFPVQQPSEAPSTAAFTQGFCFPDVPDPVANHTVGNCCSSLLLSELMLMNHEPSKKANQDDRDEKMKLQQQLSYSVTTAPNSTHSINIVPPTLCVPSPMNQIQGI